VAIVDPMQNSHQFTYGPHSMLATLTDPRQGLHKFTYDTQELLQKDEDPAGGSLTMTRTGSSDVSGDGGTTSATGLPNRVMRTGRLVFRTCSRTARHVALNFEIGVSFTLRR
jgi:YD repeat-containing protein